MLPLADACAALGHNVTFATGADLCGYVQAAGHAAVAAGLTGEEQRALIQQVRPSGFDKRDGMAFAFSTLFTRLHAPRMVPDLLDVVDRLRPDLVVHESGEYATPLVATLRRLPWVHHSYGLLRPAYIRQLATDAMTELWSDYELASPAQAGMFSRDYIDVCPRSLQSPEITSVSRRRSMRPAGTPISATLAGVPSGRPRVLVTFGTVFNRDTSLIEAIVAKLGLLPVDIVVTAGPGVHVNALAPQTGNVQVVDYVPLTQILPTCSAAVSHGGSGTMLASLAHGVPLLLLPQGADQFLNADAVTEADAGITAAAEDDLASHLERLLVEPRYRTGARRLATEIDAMPSVDEIARDLNEMG